MILQDQVVIVTGSTTGIGESIARACVAQGARVLLHGRDRARGEKLQRELGDRTAFHADILTDPQAAGRIVDAALKAFGRINALVNNAASVQRSDLENTTTELFDEIMATNVRAPLELIQAALPHLKSTRGCIANIGSLNSLGGERNLLAYSISKGALLTLSKNLANDLAYDHVRLVHFNVGWVLTENEYQVKLRDGLPEGWPETLSPNEIPSGRMTTPEQIASVVSFWISDQTRPFSGTVMELEQYPFEGRNVTRKG